MADLSITVADVLYVSGRYSIGTVGQDVIQGQAIAYDSSDGKYYLADNDSGTAARKGINGIALGAAETNQKLVFQTTGTIDIGATITQGELYVVSSTAGAICPASDLGSGDEILIIGVGDSTVNQIILGLLDTGVSHP